MDGVEPIVVGVDGSEASTVALAWAADRTSPDGLLHVVHGRSRVADLVSALRPDDDLTDDEIRRHLEGPWTEAARRAERTLRTHLVADDPADALVAVADEVGARTIVVGAHGSGGKRYGVGSVTRKLLHHSPVPIVVAKGEQFRAERPNHKPVVAFVGYGEATEDAARWAAAYAAATDRELMLVHVVGYRPMFPADSPADTVASYLGGDVSRDWAQADLNRLAAELRERDPDLNVTTKVEVGFAVRAIERRSRTAEVVVLGKRHSNPLARHTISPRVHQAIVRSATTTVVVPTCSTSH